MNAKKKGNRWENNLKNWLLDNGIKAWKDGMSGGGDKEKGDVGNNLDFTIESKASKNIKLMEWWKQVDKSANIHNNTPVLFIHKDGMGEREWLVVMHSDDWIERIVEAEPVKRQEVLSDEKREMQWKLQQVVTSCKQLLKLIK